MLVQDPWLSQHSYWIRISNFKVAAEDGELVDPVLVYSVSTRTF